MSYLQIAKPLQLACGVNLKNRFFKSAMSETMASEDGRPNNLIANLYHQWALGGAGVVVSGNVMVDHEALAEPGNVVIDSKRDLATLRRWAEAGTVNGTQLWLQINHPGRQSPKIFQQQPVAPSAIPITGASSRYFNQPRELRTDEVQQLVAKYVRTAEIAQLSGFSGVQLHGAFGYLITQFLSQETNRRTDQYGGSLANRMRFLTEIYHGIRESCGARFAISLKLSLTDINLNGFTETDLTAVIKTMAGLGIDLIELAGDDYENSELGFSGYAHMIHQLVDVPIVISGGFRNISTMEEALGRKDADMIGICTAMATMPDLPNRILADQYHPAPLKLTMGNKRLDDKYNALLVTSYCEQQARRIAAGKPVQHYANGWRALAACVKMHGTAGLVPRRPV
ncbi:NADH oxidase [Lentilactobacillus fungorum]|uniref:NADH oxidase n=1 Tax=Lentilactobacillus fungorum TaxID=2201250 RepID=A0ABQ3VZR3_9LACO|nr:NADH oxidase [Lentilactobacillus fungorum]GHP13797.1 NADH oxidase [Lentilactobacillus fungorum]